MRERLASARVDGVVWHWPADEHPRSPRWRVEERVRLLAPFDPIVWDRRRFALLWDWTYRFEAYTPAAKRKLGYYALPLLWRNGAIGWVNAQARDGVLAIEVRYVRTAPASAVFRRELAEEVERLRMFVGAERAEIR